MVVFYVHKWHRPGSPRLSLQQQRNTDRQSNQRHASAKGRRPARWLVSGVAVLAVARGGSVTRRCGVCRVAPQLEVPLDLGTPEVDRADRDITLTERVNLRVGRVGSPLGPVDAFRCWCAGGDERHPAMADLVLQSLDSNGGVVVGGTETEVEVILTSARIYIQTH